MDIWELGGLSDSELRALHDDLHDRWNKRDANRAIEYSFVNPHLFVEKEMMRRGMEHTTRDGLDVESEKLREFDQFILVQDYISLVGSAVNDAHPNDIDVLVRGKLTDGLRDSIYILIRKLFDPQKTGLQIHILESETGPHKFGDEKHIPLFDLALIPKMSLYESRAPRATHERVSPITRYVVQKPRMTFYTDFIDIDELWENWGADNVPLMVSPKVDGFRTIVQKSGDTVSIYFEDSKEERNLPVLIDELRNIDHNFIIEGEFVVYKDGIPLARPQLFSYLAGNIDGDPRIFLYDILYYDKYIGDKPFIERYEILKSFDTDHISVLKQYKVANKKELLDAMREISELDDIPIEGIIARREDMPYTFGATNDYTKTKSYLEIKARVVDITKTSNGYTYTIELEGHENIGRTFVTKEKLADVGDTLNVRVEEVLLYPDGHIALGKPSPLGVDRSRGPYTVDQVIAMAQRYRVLKKIKNMVPNALCRYSDAVKEILCMMPDHDRYVEQIERDFSVFYYKPRSETEILHISDPQILELAKSIQTASDNTLDILRAKDWNISDNKRKYVSNLNPVTTSGKLYKLLCEFLDNGKFDNIIESIKSLRERLTGVIISGEPITDDGRSLFVVRDENLWNNIDGNVIGILDKRLGPHTMVEGHIINTKLPDDTRAEAALRNWESNWYKALPLDGNSRPFILHAHVRGIPREHIDKGLEELIMLGHSVHYDLRMGAAFDGAWGITIFSGPREDNKEPRIFQLMKKPIAMGSQPKLFMPPEWLTLALDKPYVSEPGSVGATSKSYAKFFAIDHGSWRLGFARQHAVELWLDGNHLKGRFMWVYAPLDNTRRWVFSRPKDQEPYASKHSLEEVLDDIEGQKYLIWPENGHHKLYKL